MSETATSGNEVVSLIDEAVVKVLDRIRCDLKEDPEVKAAVLRHINGINFAKPIKAACEELVLSMMTKNVKELDNVEAAVNKGIRDAQNSLGAKPLTAKPSAV